MFKVFKEDRILAARSLAAQLSGGVREVILPAVPEHRPRTRTGAEIPRLNTGHLGNGMFNMAGLRHTEPAYMTLAEDAKLRDTQITINHSGMEGLRPGHYFGIGERLHLVSMVWSDGFEYDKVVGGTLGFKGDSLVYGSGNNLIYGSTRTRTLGTAVQHVQFWPPLRENAETGTQVIVGSPVCKMTVQNPEEVLPRLDRGIHGQVEIQFRESV